MDNKKLFQKRCKKYKGQLVLNSFEVEMVLDFAEDDMDYYYVTYNLRTGKVWHTFVGDFIPLKSRLSKKKYDYMLEVFKLNKNMRERASKELEKQKKWKSFREKIN
jgi:hypothetical protein